MKIVIFADEIKAYHFFNNEIFYLFSLFEPTMKLSIAMMLALFSYNDSGLLHACSDYNVDAQCGQGSVTRIPDDVPEIYVMCYF